MKKNNRKLKSGFWIILVAAIVLEGTSCVQYFFSRAGIRKEAEQRARTELRKAELEIEKHTIEMEAAAKMLSKLAESHVNNPDSVAAATRVIVSTIEHTTSVAVAFVPDYFPSKGKFYEPCSSRISDDSVFTRNIGSAEHDYTLMEWYQDGFVHDSCWWCEPYLDDSGSQAWVVSCSYPVRNAEGEVVAVVCVDLSLDYLQDMSEYLQVYPESFYSISSSTGGEIVPIGDTIPGRRYHTFDREIQATGWHISIVIPDDVMFADLRRISLLVSILMLLGLALLVLIVLRSGKVAQRLAAVSSQNERIENELTIARTIQMAMLPKVFPPFLDRLDMNVYGMVEPAKEIGGDLYDFYVRNDKLFFAIGDVSGKGIPAALVMAMTRSLFRSVTAYEERAEHIMMRLNEALTEQNDQNMFVTLFLGVLDLTTGKLNYCNAGHNAPILHQRFMDVKHNLPLGVQRDFAYEAQQIQMHYNDALFLYTDGLTEAENGKHEQYGEQQMLDKIIALVDSRPREVVEQMYADVKRFVDGAQQSDDLTMLCIRYQTPAIVMRNDIQQIPTLAEWIDALGIPQDLNMPINLALEEAVSNVMLYAYPGRDDGKVIVEFVRSKTLDGERLLFTITDTGIPFDPTAQKEADITLSAEERSIGGLGIHLVRQIMDEVVYRREETRNILTLIKKLS
ncbi:MAG: SpoIIE family protein phosphatase [Bacteroidales bacterium]|nr:SpoIIE family protein phosphatase [Bacteroidales bacterium]